MLVKVNAHPEYRAEVVFLVYGKLEFTVFSCCFWFSAEVAFTFFPFLTSLCLMNLQIMWLVDTFRARIVDIAEHALTIEVHLAYDMCCSWYLFLIITYGFRISVFILLLIIGRHKFFCLGYHLKIAIQWLDFVAFWNWWWSTCRLCFMMKIKFMCV